MKRSSKYSKGQMIVLYAGLVATLLGATALCTDVAMMYMNSTQLQKATDAAAIAGANYLTGLAFSGTATGCTTQSDDAKKAACTYATNNGIATDGLTITEPSSSTITVAAQRNGLPYYFGKVIGLNTYSVAATATGQASQAVGTVKHGMFPVGLQCTNPCTLSNMNPGQGVSFGSKFVGGLAPGNWQWLDPTGGSGGGDAALTAAITSGTTTSFTIGSPIVSEPGNKGNSSPVKTGLTGRLNACPTISDPCTSAGGNPNNIPASDPCLVIVPAVDYHGCTGSCPITIEGFALIYLEPTGPNASTSTNINGCFVKAVAADTITSITAPQLGAEMPPSLIN